MPIPDSVAQLVDNFAANRSEYHKGDYNETQTRIDYVNPLFAALGWDMDNQEGLSELLREVIHEDKIKIGGHSKAPDYSFRTGGARKFFVETKKPGVNLYLLEAPAFQLRRYAWTVKMPVSILTNFEEFAVYDTRVRPDQKDAAKTARLDYFKYTDYAEKWDEIEARFSRDAVFSGAFDKYAAEARDKRIAVPVDVAFLGEISGWRETLARNIALNNPGLGSRELNYAVQMTIDRIIFLRISEDRGAEPDFLLQPLQNKGGAVYPRLLDIFRRADARYNSGLFHFGAEAGRDNPDTVTPHLTLDDRPLKEIIGSIYYPESSFEFSVFPADILGQVYEQFLGKVIRVSGHTAEVEDKPEVKKAGGVYYTPTYIVDYIVRNTVGKLVEGKTPAQVSKLTILDPACGSGSFLIGAYQFLLDWHLRYYLDQDRAKYAKGKSATIYLFKKDPKTGEVWRLTTAEKKRILLNNIYGVDIDTQAVEVSKLSLLLKVLEGESAELIDNSLKLFKERALPDLENNIKCGNSLIGPDFYEGKDMALFDLDAQLKINTFDWNTGFPSVMKSGGFDAVIGNPPYVILEDGFRDDEQSDYFKAKYSTASYKIDLYHLFIEMGINSTKVGGYSSMITPANFLTNNYLEKLRRYILTNSGIDHLLVIDKGVFKKVGVDNAIFVLCSTSNSAAAFPIYHANPANNLEATSQIKVSVSEALNSKFALFTGASSASSDLLTQKVLSISDKLGDVAYVNFGKQLRDRKKYPTDVVQSKTLLDLGSEYRPCYTGRDVVRYEVNWGNLACFDNEIARQGGCWDPEKQNTKNKLLTRQVGKYPEFGLDTLGYQCLNTMFMLNIYREHIRPEYLLGLLNSRLLRYVWLDKFYDGRHTFPKIKGTFLKELPIRTIDFAKPAEKAQHDKMVSLVERMLTLHKDKAAARLATEKTMLQRQIEATDRQIDALVYELYGLTEDEIKVVEGTG